MPSSSTLSCPLSQDEFMEIVRSYRAVYANHVESSCQRCAHQGRDMTMSFIRSDQIRYWIENLSSVVATFIHKCISFAGNCVVLLSLKNVRPTIREG